jgi:hypothetical protein
MREVREVVEFLLGDRRMLRTAARLLQLEVRERVRIDKAVVDGVGEHRSQGVHDEMNLSETSIGVQAIKRTGQPEALTGAPSYLVSDEAGFVTG